MFVAKSRYLPRCFKQIQQQSAILALFQGPQYSKNIVMSSNTFKNSLVKNYFATKKPAPIQKPIQKESSKIDHSQQQSEFLSKLNIFLNTVGIGMGFYFPTSAISFVLSSNAIMQMYESGKGLNRVKELFQKSPSLTMQQFTECHIQIKSIVKKITISSVIALAFSISTAYGVINPAFTDYSLIGLNFWIFYNIKMNNFSHGYYLALISLLVFEYFYFQRIFAQGQKPQNKNN